MRVATAEYIAVVYVSTESIAAKAATTIAVTIEATIATTLELGYFIIQLWVGSISWSWSVFYHSRIEGYHGDGDAIESHRL